MSKYPSFDIPKQSVRKKKKKKPEVRKIPIKLHHITPSEAAKRKKRKKKMSGKVKR